MTRLADAEGTFDYYQAFDRNIGWLTPQEQERLRLKRVAIAGLGGAGGIELLTLVRLGIERFSLADFDKFELGNFNRQAGATVSGLGRKKLDVMLELVKDINPRADVRLFPAGVTKANAHEFLDSVDIYVDALDFFAIDARILVFEACAKLRIPATTVAPLGMGAALLNFLPGRMSFDEYFGLAGRDEDEQQLRLLVGLSPALLQRAYVADPTKVNFAERRAPSTAMACQLCGGIAATEALKILLERGRVYAAPWVVHFDAYRNTLRRTFRPFGNRNPLQRLVLAIARRQLKAMRAAGGGTSQTH
jgi:molybdopterin/thiamine biosynthesis adenylyltransferase